MATNITGLPNANVDSVTQQQYLATSLKKMWDNFFVRSFVSNEFNNQVDGVEQGDVVNIRFKPVLADAELITNRSTGSNTYADINYGKMTVSLDFALSGKFRWQNADKSIQNLDFDEDGTTAAVESVLRTYEKQVISRMRTSAAIPGGQIFGTSGTALNKRAFDRIRTSAKKLNIPGSERIFVMLDPDSFEQLFSIQEFNQTTWRISETVEGINPAEQMTIGGNLNMTFINTNWYERPVPATDPVATAFIKGSVVTPIRPLIPSGTGFDSSKTYNGMGMTMSQFVSDARLGVNVNKKLEAVCGFKETPIDINTSGVTSGVALWNLRGGI